MLSRAGVELGRILAAAVNRDAILVWRILLKFVNNDLIVAVAGIKVRQPDPGADVFAGKDRPCNEPWRLPSHHAWGTPRKLESIVCSLR
jgi:hypothetical protein